MNKAVLKVELTLAVCAGMVAHADVMGWRGDGTGIFKGGAAPLHWSQSEGIAWKTSLPDWANACPILVHGRLFVTAEPNQLICLSAADGSVVWKRSERKAETVPEAQRADFAAKATRYEELNRASQELKSQIRNMDHRLRKKPDNAEALKAEKEELNARKMRIDNERSALSAYGRPKTHNVNGYTTPTPVSDGTHVYVQFGDGVVASHALDGERKWIRFVASSKHGWGHSASPVLVDNKLILHIADTVYALNPADGTTLWTAASKSNWGTPASFQIGGQWAIMTTGGDVVRVSDGHVCAREIAALPWTSPLAEGGALYVVDINAAIALRLPGAMADELEFEVLWQEKPAKNRYYATPLLVDGLLYAIHRTGELSVFDAAHGTLVYSKKLSLGGTAYPSPFFAGGHIYVSADTGKTVVLKPGREYVEVARNSLEGFRSTPISDSGKIYIRGLKHLYCITGTSE